LCEHRSAGAPGTCLQHTMLSACAASLTRPLQCPGPPSIQTTLSSPCFPGTASNRSLLRWPPACRNWPVCGMPWNHIAASGPYASSSCNGYVAYPFHNQKVNSHPANCSATSVALTNLMQASVFQHCAPFDVLLLATPGKTPNRRCCTFSGSRLVDEVGKPLHPSERRSSALSAALCALSRLRAAPELVHRSDASSRCVVPARRRLTGGVAGTRWAWLHP
jgi:hypothetical protein